MEMLAHLNRPITNIPSEVRSLAAEAEPDKVPAPHTARLVAEKLLAIAIPFLIVIFILVLIAILIAIPVIILVFLLTMIIIVHPAACRSLGQQCAGAVDVGASQRHGDVC